MRRQARGVCDTTSYAVSIPDLSCPLNHFLSLGLPGALPLQKDVVSRLINMLIDDQPVRKDSVGNQGLHSLDIVNIVMGMMACVFLTLYYFTAASP